jgi:ubiquinone/menaquinone biosynthesis C-methylase UbiE
MPETTAATSATEYRAYARLDRNDRTRELELAARLGTLVTLSKEIESPLVRDLKPVIALALKWKFDFLAKRLESPFELEHDVAYWTSLLQMLRALSPHHWFPLGSGPATLDVWKRTARAFDVGWTTTTEGDRFQTSSEIARERLDQIVAMLGGAEWISGKAVLDSGCGPGRYVHLLRALMPRSIIAFDQGPLLMDALRRRFGSDPAVRILRGTCEALAFADESFDFVLSNGVLHHTKSDLQTMIVDHARVLRPGGAMFIMLVGKGGLELKLWQFLRGFLYDVPVEEMLNRFGAVVSPLRLQGIVDHMYGEYQETDREEFEAWCRPLFRRIERVPGVAGLDVTPEVYADDPYFAARFGCGQLRYLCFR